MIKSELVARVAARNPSLNHREAEQIVATIFDEITTALARGDRVELRGFGAFSVKRRPARVGRNPRTGDAVSVAQKSVPYFKTGKELRERLNIDAKANPAPSGGLTLMRLSTVFVAVPIGIVAIAFAVANRQSVALSLDPLPWTVDVPLFAVLYAGIVAGLLIGIVAEWWRERRLRRAAREARAAAASLQRENAALKSSQAALSAPVRSGP